MFISSSFGLSQFQCLWTRENAPAGKPDQVIYCNDSNVLIYSDKFYYLNLLSGKNTWKSQCDINEFIADGFIFPDMHVSVVDERIFLYDLGIHCFGIKDGNLLWEISDFKCLSRSFFVVDNNLMVTHTLSNVDGIYLSQLNTDSGKIVSTIKISDIMLVRNQTTNIQPIFKYDDESILFLNSGIVTRYDTKSETIVWRYKYTELYLPYNRYKIVNDTILLEWIDYGDNTENTYKSIGLNIFTGSQIFVQVTDRHFCYSKSHIIS
jgi:hypothetical protein